MWWWFPLAWGAEVSCPEDTVPRSTPDAHWCVAEGGVPHGPFTALRGSEEQVTGAFVDGVPVGRWSVYDRKGELRARSPVSAGVLAGCAADDTACWVSRVEEELDEVWKRARRLDAPALVRAGKGRTGGFDGRTMLVEFWSLWRLDIPEVREGFGLQAGLTELYTADGRIRLRAEHDGEGHLTGTFTVFDRFGRPLRRAGYLGGWLHGEEQSWYRAGGKRGSVRWDRGALHGAVRWWDAEGQQIVEGAFDEGRPCGWFTLRDLRAAKNEMCTL